MKNKVYDVEIKVTVPVFISVLAENEQEAIAKAKKVPISDERWLVIDDSNDDPI